MAKKRNKPMNAHDREVMEARMVESQVERHEYVTTIFNNIGLLLAMAVVLALVATILGSAWAIATFVGLFT